ncbi:MAG: hypothetical protein M3405_05500 [Acidobacteriota bacterium]|jgi:hypothetical protein|nr:hypothetical protein [Acidobacteriota bacterium]
MSLNEKMKINFEAYGVTIGIDFQEPFEFEKILKIVKNAIPINLNLINNLETNTDTEHIFKIRSESENQFSLQKNVEEKTRLNDEQKLLESLESNLRLTIGEHAKSKVFIHAGVVELGGSAIIIPALSFKGKTSLVVELIKAGATYYSDEYAIVDEKGLVYPFPKSLSVRGIIDKYTQLERPVDFYGGKKGENPIRAGLILITEYQIGSHWKPQILSQGEAVLELISNTLPIRNKPEFTLGVLNKLANDAYAIKTKRGEAKRFAKNLLKYYKMKILQQ